MRTRRWTIGLAIALVAGTLVATGIGSAAPAASDRIDLKVLVVSSGQTEPAFDAWKAFLGREQVPFDVFDTTSGSALTASDLSADRHAFYQAVICASECLNVLDAAEITALNAFQASFGIRRVSAYVWPWAAYGLNMPSFSGTLDDEMATLTGAGATVFPYLRGSVPIDTWTWGYLTTPLDGAPFETLLEGPGGSSLIGIYQNPAGFEEMVVTFDVNAYQLHAMLLGHGQLAWATRGLYTGYNRAYFVAHIDDVFLSDDRWDTKQNVTPEDDGKAIRMVPSDVDRALQWSIDNGLRIDMVFNGAGSVESTVDAGRDRLTEALVEHKDAFGWINHTFEHLNLDAASEAIISSEIQTNIDFAQRLGLPIDAGELVTGEHSGLGNPAMPAALAATGITSIAADNSRQPDQYSIGGALTVPRHPSNVYYNVGTAAELLDEYNYIYYERCNPLSPPPNTTCLTRAATWSEFVDSEADIMLRHLLTNDPRPHYFHQSNLAEDGTFYLVVDEVLARYRRYMAAGLVQPSQREAGTMLQRVDAWQSAQPGVTAYYQAGAVHLLSPVSVAVPLTGFAAGDLYGGLRSGWIQLAAGAEMIVDVDDPGWSGTTDVVAPVITLLGENPLVVTVGGSFVDPGATASDDVDGDVSASIVVDSSGVDTSVVGDYGVTYDVSDAAGNAAVTQTRVVSVIDGPSVVETVEVRVGSSGDDVEEMWDGWLYVGSSDLELTEDPRPQVVGLRFAGLMVPQGATITAAWVQFTVDERSSGASGLVLRVIDGANAAAFGGWRGVSSRPLAGVSVDWAAPSWDVVGAAGPEQRSADISVLVQAIVGRADWVSGNALALVITGTGRRVAESYDGNRNAAPILHIEYTMS